MKFTKVGQEWSETDRLRWIAFNSAQVLVKDGQEVIKGLNQIPKTLPGRYFYDDLGSELFEQMTELPAYYLTRIEQTLLERYALEIAQLTGICELVELGSGSSRKTRLLLEAYDQLNHQLYYYPIDVSAGILKTTALSLLKQYPRLRLCILAGTYEQALSELPAPELENRMLIFLGSSLGNLPEPECQMFLAQIQKALRPGDFFLLGIDLQKPINILEAAYNDNQGVTAAFNLNILRHLNQRFQGSFVLEHFEHKEAFYNSQAHQVEMYLHSLKTQTAVLEALNYQVNIQAGETIRTGISRKFQIPTLVKILAAHALYPLNIWTDHQDWFGLLLCQRRCQLEED
jgi:L-histidine Nalpha-methyltransferase